jgi:hypothetical protein
MAERRKTRVVAAISIGRRRGRRHPGQWPDATAALTALFRAWMTTVVASLLFVAALAVSQVWDGAVFRQALRDSLASDPQLAQPIDDFSVTESFAGDNPSPK